jgi:hypothetical protein
MDRKFEWNPSPDWVEADRYLDVNGIQFRKAAASAFAEGEMTVLSFEREPNNPNDPNALRVIGTWDDHRQTKRLHVGYVDSVTARRIARGQLFDVVCPWLRQVLIPESGYIAIRYDLLIEAKMRSAFEAICQDDAEHFSQLRSRILRESLVPEPLIALVTRDLSISDSNSCLFGSLFIPKAHREEPFDEKGQINLFVYAGYRIFADLALSPPRYFLVNENVDGSQPVLFRDCLDAVLFVLFSYALQQEELYATIALTRTGRPKGLAKVETDPDKPKLIEALANVAEALHFRWLPQTVLFWKRCRDSFKVHEHLRQVALLFSSIEDVQRHLSS